ncbi:MAG: hypothetical protein ABIH26_13710 [Candidatus Eisenbacteria bacterium]
MARGRLAVLAVSALLVSSCGDTIGTDTLGPPDATEAERFLSGTFPALFEDQDAEGYASSLHPDFRFLFLENEAPAEYPGGFWGKRTEAAVIGSLFADTSVVSTAMEISVLEEALSLVPGTRNEWAYRATTLTEIGYGFREPGSDFVESAYIFTKIEHELRRDLSNDRGWLLYEQIERPAQFGGGKGLAQGLSWGEAKGLFYRPIELPASRIVKGTVSLDTAGVPAAGAAVSVGDRTATADSYGRFIMEAVDPSIREAAFTKPGALGAIVPIGGGDDVYRIEVVLRSYTFQTTPDAFLPDFADAYAAMDSALYASFLDARYRFELLPQDVDPDSTPFWGTATELKIAGRMFGGRWSDNGARVNRIALDFGPAEVLIDTTSYPGKPAGETWHRVTALVDLKVAAEDPEDPEGIINFIVISYQVFVVRPDPFHPERYLVTHQIDQEPLNVKPRGTEESSWSALKSIWR